MSMKKAVKVFIFLILFSVVFLGYGLWPRDQQQEMTLEAIQQRIATQESFWGGFDSVILAVIVISLLGGLILAIIDKEPRVPNPFDRH